MCKINSNKVFSPLISTVLIVTVMHNLATHMQVQVGVLLLVAVGELMYVEPSYSFPKSAMGAIAGVVLASVLVIGLIIVAMVMCFQCKLRSLKRSSQQMQAM